MSAEQGLDKKFRIALGIAGFLILAISTPCILVLIRDGYARQGDLVGMFGIGGLILLVLYVGIICLYQAFKSPRPAPEEE